MTMLRPSLHTSPSSQPTSPDQRPSLSAGLRTETSTVEIIAFVAQFIKHGRLPARLALVETQLCDARMLVTGPHDMYKEIKIYYRH